MENFSGWNKIPAEICMRAEISYPNTSKEPGFFVFGLHASVTKNHGDEASSLYFYFISARGCDGSLLFLVKGEGGGRRKKGRDKSFRGEFTSTGYEVFKLFSSSFVIYAQALIFGDGFFGPDELEWILEGRTFFLLRRGSSKVFLIEFLAKICPWFDYDYDCCKEKNYYFEF